MKNKFVYLTLIILVLCVVLVGCANASAKEIKINTSDTSLYLGETMNANVKMSDGSLPSGRVTFTTADSSIIEVVEQLSDSWVKIKAVGVGTAKLKAEFKERTKEIDITVKPKYDSIGNGTAQSPFEISELEHLEVLLSSPDKNEGKYFRLTSDIVIEKEWYAPSLTGEAYLGHTFKGYFDGNGKTIEFLQGRGCLFGDNEGTIRNLKVKGQGVGAFIADTNHGEISNCFVEGNISIMNMFNQFGGMVNYNLGTIRNCISNVNITGDEHTYTIGGICGVIESGIIENCIFLGSITVNTAYNNGTGVGAIIGQRYSEEAILKNLYYDVSIISQNNTNTSYFYPDRAVGFHGVGIPISETENVTNVMGISDWQSMDFSDLDSDYWDFDEIIPYLKSFK